MTRPSDASSLLIINLMLMIVIISLWLTDIGARLEEVPADSASPISMLSKESASFNTPPISEYKVIVDRPLFDKSRRPQKKPVPARERSVLANDAAQHNVPFKLIGSMVMPMGNEAMLKMTPGGEVFRRRSGEALQGWTIDTVREDYVVVRSGDTAVEIYLERRSSAKPPSRPPRGQSKTVKQKAMRELRVRK